MAKPQYAPDPRIEKLPAWAREMISGLRGDVRQLERENTALRTQLAGITEREAADTVLVAEHAPATVDDIPSKPLGSGVHIRFADFYEVHYGDVGSGARALIIETDGPMAIVPTKYGRERIIIRRA